MSDAIPCENKNICPIFINKQRWRLRFDLYNAPEAHEDRELAMIEQGGISEPNVIVHAHFFSSLATGTKYCTVLHYCTVVTIALMLKLTK